MHDAHGETKRNLDRTLLIRQEPLQALHRTLLLSSGRDSNITIVGDGFGCAVKVGQRWLVLGGHALAA